MDVDALGQQAFRRGVRDRPADVGGQLPGLFERRRDAEVQHLALGRVRKLEVRRLQVVVEQTIRPPFHHG